MIPEKCHNLSLSIYCMQTSCCQMSEILYYYKKLVYKLVKFWKRNEININKIILLLLNSYFILDSSTVNTSIG